MKELKVSSQNSSVRERIINLGIAARRDAAALYHILHDGYSLRNAAIIWYNSDLADLFNKGVPRLHGITCQEMAETALKESITPRDPRNVFNPLKELGTVIPDHIMLLRYTSFVRASAYLSEPESEAQDAAGYSNCLVLSNKDISWIWNRIIENPLLAVSSLMDHFPEFKLRSPTDYEIKIADQFAIIPQTSREAEAFIRRIYEINGKTEKTEVRREEDKEEKKAFYGSIFIPADPSSIPSIDALLRYRAPVFFSLEDAVSSSEGGKELLIIEAEMKDDHDVSTISYEKKGAGWIQNIIDYFVFSNPFEADVISGPYLHKETAARLADIKNVASLYTMYYEPVCDMVSAMLYKEPDENIVAAVISPNVYNSFIIKAARIYRKSNGIYRHSGDIDIKEWDIQ